MPTVFSFPRKAILSGPFLDGPVGAGHERTWLPADPQAGCGQSEASHPLLFPRVVLSAPSFHHSHRGGIWEGTPRRPLYKLKILAGQCGDHFTLWLPPTDLLRKFPCFLNWPAANLGWSVSFSTSPHPGFVNQHVLALELIDHQDTVISASCHPFLLLW